MVKKLMVFRWVEIEEVFKRKYLNRYQAIDIQTMEKKVLTFNLLLPIKAEKFIEAVLKYQAEFAYTFSVI